MSVRKIHEQQREAVAERVCLKLAEALQKRGIDVQDPVAAFSSTLCREDNYQHGVSELYGFRYKCLVDVLDRKPAVLEKFAEALAISTRLDRSYRIQPKLVMHTAHHLLATVEDGDARIRRSRKAVIR